MICFPSFQNILSLFEAELGMAQGTFSPKMKKSGQLLEIDELLVDVWGKLEVNAPSIGLYWPFWFCYPAQPCH